jgi:hypothetical protein
MNEPREERQLIQETENPLQGRDSGNPRGQLGRVEDQAVAQRTLLSLWRWEWQGTWEFSIEGIDTQGRFKYALLKSSRKQKLKHSFKNKVLQERKYSYSAVKIRLEYQ